MAFQTVQGATGADGGLCRMQDDNWKLMDPINVYFDTKNTKHAIYYISQLENKCVLMTCNVWKEFKSQSVNAESSSNGI